MPKVRLYLFMIASCVVGCGGTSEISPPALDLATTPPDLAAVDLAPGPSCGEMVLCGVVQCGLDVSCAQKCASGASPAELAKAGAITFCALQHCVDVDAGITPQIFQCLGAHCSKELAACDGLPFGVGP